MVASLGRPRILLVAGAIAGPLLLSVIGIDGATRPEYDMWRHGVSQLVLGDLGWLDRAVYVVTGLLVVVHSAGMRRVLVSGVGASWGPRLIAAMGVGLIVAGVFPTDPALGYPAGEPVTVTVAGRVHVVGGTVLFAGLVGTCFVLGKRLSREGHQGWAAYSLATGVLVTGSAVAAGVVYRLETGGVIVGWPAGALERVAFLAGFVWLAASAAHLARRSQPREGRVTGESPKAAR